ncbi:MAG: hypothetical protein WB660_21200 [Candidatus Sulfotelmatobacter sp.]
MFNRQEELAHSLSGRLLPGNEPVTHLCGWPIPAGAVVLLYGSNRSLVRDFSTTVHPVLVSMKFGQVIEINRSWDGSITVFLDIRDSDRKIIARLNQDGFVVNRSNFLEMRRDKSHLKIVDEYGDDVLDVDYMIPKTIRMMLRSNSRKASHSASGYNQGMENLHGYKRTCVDGCRNALERNPSLIYFCGGINFSGLRLLTLTLERFSGFDWSRLCTIPSNFLRSTFKLFFCTNPYHFPSVSFSIKTP